VVELNRTNAQLLADLVELEELNKTTLVNRAIKLYALVREMERAGGALYLQTAPGGPLERQRLL